MLLHGDPPFAAAQIFIQIQTIGPAKRLAAGQDTIYLAATRAENKPKSRISRADTKDSSNAKTHNFNFYNLDVKLPKQ